MYAAYKNKVQFFLIYIREAHPEERRNGKPIGQPKTLDQRAILATQCTTELKLSLPILMDTMAGVADKAYGGRPDRICVVDVDGRVAYHSKRGPWGFKPKVAEEVLKKILANGGRIAAKD